jgi:hypothetical protein
MPITSARREVDDREPPAGLQRANDIGVELSGLDQMMVDTPQKNGITARRG